MTSRKRIRVGVVGVGYLGRLHAEKYAMIEEAELVGVADLDAKRAAEVAASVNTKAFGSYREMFGLVDAVSVVTPTEGHCPVGLEFLTRGVDVLVEKPIAMNLSEADRLVDEAKKSGCVLQVGHLERFNAAVAALEGRLARPVLMEARRLSPFPNRSTDVDVVLDVMIHDIDIVLHLAGSGVEAVEAAGVPVVSGKTDIAAARLVFKNGCAASITASRVAREKVRRLDIYSADGSVAAVDFAAQQLSISRPVQKEGAPVMELVDDALDIAKRDSLLEELKSFVICSASRTAPPVTGEDGREALRVAGMIQERIRASAAKAGA